MKIKSISDVITNSSSEVFICRISDLEEAKKELKDIDEEFWEEAFKQITTVEEAQELFSNSGSIYFYDLQVSTKGYVPFHLSNHEKELLKKFGHSKKELAEYEKNEELKRLEERDKNQEVKDKIIGSAIYDNESFGDFSSDLYKLSKWFNDKKKRPLYHGD